MELFGAERGPGLYLAKPALPIDIFGLRFILQEVVPLARYAVAAVKALAPNQGPQFAAFDELGALVPTRGGAALRTDLIDLSGALNCVINLEGLVEVAGHRLLAIDMLAGFHRFHRDLRVPRVVSSNQNRVDILPIEDLFVIVMDVGLFEF